MWRHRSTKPSQASQAEANLKLGFRVGIGLVLVFLLAIDWYRDTFGLRRPPSHALIVGREG